MCPSASKVFSAMEIDRSQTHVSFARSKTDGSHLPLSALWCHASVSPMSFAVGGNGMA
jgi:hypothetical protein